MGCVTRAPSGAGKWTVQQAAELSVAAPTIEAALDGRFLSGLKEERVEAAELFAGLGAKAPSVVSVRRIFIERRLAHREAPLCKPYEEDGLLRARAWPTAMPVGS